MPGEQAVHEFFARLESAVRLVARTDCETHGFDRWFRADHHLGFQERWDRFRSIRHKSNQTWIASHSELLDELYAGFEGLVDAYWLCKPDLESVEFQGKQDDIILQVFELLRAAINWHHRDYGYWENSLIAADESDAMANREQIESSDRQYPMQPEQGREWVQVLRTARGLILRHVDPRKETAKGGRPAGQVHLSRHEQDCIRMAMEGKSPSEIDEMIMARSEPRRKNGEPWDYRTASKVIKAAKARGELPVKKRQKTVS